MPSIPLVATLSSCLLVAANTLLAADPWPGSSGGQIGGGLPSGYEPSGAVWHAGLQRLVIVGDGGQVTTMDADGSDVTTWSVGGDLEGVTVVDPEDTTVLLGREHPDAVLEFDLDTGVLTGNAWDLTPWMTGPDNRGLEALTYVDGRVYAGLQDDGSIFVFELQSGGTVVHHGTLTSPFGRDDVSGLHYEAGSGVLHALYDSFDVIVEMLPDGTFLREYDLPGSDQEGVALAPDCATATAGVFISQDTGEVVRYSAYPNLCSWTSLGQALAGTHGAPTFDVEGALSPGIKVTFTLDQALENALSYMVFSLARLDAPFKGGILVPDPSPPSLIIPLLTGPTGGWVVSIGAWPSGVPSGSAVYLQVWIVDSGGPKGFSASNGLEGVTP